VCKKNISWLYPFIELLTTLLLTLLYVSIPHQYFLGYFVFFSALIVTIRSDIETMLISRFVTIFLVPLSCIFSATMLLPITLTECIAGALFGYLFLFSINTIFAYLRNKQGIGEGDFDLLIYIGSCTGILGCWISITLGSLIGSFYGLYTLINTENNNDFSTDTKIPFGPFLAAGAILFVFLQKHFFNYLMLT